ncbi:MAG: polyprenyl synthetase family protein [Gammaproteobacteria bacterium]|nr:polyprenyl synthetase family protein [Gammaproteobacteria bacterium]MCY4166013.1 polyprenyl synthetase family protein [Gammaproteobacteria bacterium]MCY4256131.1 polyprenyl synthetase family protein [Gammaproteobacteria bacterium]MCY4341201.1 polyprenyl synthetase family protein [Gammaproteobacteria bacterium]
MKTNDNFEQRREDYRNRVNAALNDCLPAPEIIPRQLHAAMRDAVLRGGKRLRPLLCYAAAEATGVPARLMDAPAAAVELIHCYSLVHDDLPCMDDDELRRGQPTIHRIYGEDVALLAGDALQTLAWEVLAAHPSLMERNDARVALSELFAQCSGSTGMVGGQELDLRGGPEPDLAELEHAYRTKTGGLFRAAVLSPVCVQPEMPLNFRHALEQFADALGLAFQIRDDFNDKESDAQALISTESSRLPSWVARFGEQAARERLEELVGAMQEACQTFGAAGAGLRWLTGFIGASVPGAAAADTATTAPPGR